MSRSREGTVTLGYITELAKYMDEVLQTLRAHVTALEQDGEHHATFSSCGVWERLQRDLRIAKQTIEQATHERRFGSVSNGPNGTKTTEKRTRAAKKTRKKRGS